MAAPAPTRQEVERYAEYLGIHPEEEREHLWIAELGLRSALRPPWLACHAADSNALDDPECFFFFHERAGVGSSADAHPAPFLDAAPGEDPLESPCDAYCIDLLQMERSRKEVSKDEPCLIATIQVLPMESDSSDELVPMGTAVLVSAIGMDGDVLAKTVVMSPHERWQACACRLKKQLGGKVQFLLPDAGVVTESEWAAVLSRVQPGANADVSALGTGGVVRGSQQARSRGAGLTRPHLRPPRRQ